MSCTLFMLVQAERLRKKEKEMYWLLKIKNSAWSKIKYGLFLIGFYTVNLRLSPRGIICNNEFYSGGLFEEGLFAERIS